MVWSLFINLVFYTRYRSIELWFHWHEFCKTILQRKNRCKVSRIDNQEPQGPQSLFKPTPWASLLYIYDNFYSFNILGAFTKLRKATISFVMSACLFVCLSLYLSVRPSAWNNSVPTGRIFMKFDIWASFETLSRKFQVSLKSDKNNG